MILYHHPISAYSRKVFVAMNHRGDSVEYRTIDVFGGELRSESYRALSPFGKMPVLVTDGDGPIFESTSIIEYLEDRGPRCLLPDEHARVARQFDRIGDLYLIEPMGAMWFTPRSREAEEAPATLAIAWSLLERQLGQKAFVCGDSFTLGDLSPAIATENLGYLGVTPPKAVAAWLARCQQVPALALSRESAQPYLPRLLKTHEQRRQG